MFLVHFLVLPFLLFFIFVWPCQCQKYPIINLWNPNNYLRNRKIFDLFLVLFFFASLFATSSLVWSTLLMGRNLSRLKQKGCPPPTTTSPSLLSPSPPHWNPLNPVSMPESISARSARWNRAHSAICQGRPRTLRWPASCSRIRNPLWAGWRPATRSECHFAFGRGGVSDVPLPGPFPLDFEAPLALRFSLRVLLDLGSWARAAVSSIFPEVFGELTVRICCVLVSLTMAEANSLESWIF